MSSNLFCNINGNLIYTTASSYKSLDDAFRLRYGVYETYLFKNGNLEYSELHQERLLNGLIILGFEVPTYYTNEFFIKQIKELVKTNGGKSLSKIRLQIFTDSIQKPFKPQFLIEFFDLNHTVIDWIDVGIKVSILKNFHKKINFDANFKISHNDHFLLSRAEIMCHKLDDELLLNSKGNIIESAIANVFWIKDGKIFTPPLSEGCLAGTIRKILIENLKINNLFFEEKPFTLTEIYSADEVFLTNSLRKIRWIREIDGFVYGNEFIRKNLKKIFFEE